MAASLILKVKKCAHCGSVILENDGLDLTQRHRNIYEIIRKHQPCSAKEIAVHLFGSDADGGPTSAPSMVSMYVRQLNREIAKIKRRIVNRSRDGYEILSTERIR